jgi:hypothetical protein
VQSLSNINPNQQPKQNLQTDTQASISSLSKLDSYEQHRYGHRHTPSNSSSMNATDLHRYSMITHSSTSSGEKEYIKNLMRETIRETLDIELGSRSRHPTGYPGRHGTLGSYIDTMSINSGSTGASEKRAAKLEKLEKQA